MLSTRWEARVSVRREPWRALSAPLRRLPGRGAPSWQSARAIDLNAAMAALSKPWQLPDTTGPIVEPDRVGDDSSACEAGRSSSMCSSGRGPRTSWMRSVISRGRPTTTVEESGPVCEKPLHCLALWSEAVGAGTAGAHDAKGGSMAGTGRDPRLRRPMWDEALRNGPESAR